MTTLGMTEAEPERGDQTEDFATALRAAILQRGLTLDRVRYRLGQHGYALSVATLSYWQSGRSRPDRATSLAALGSLEEILQVPRGSLASRLPRRVRKPRRGANTIPVIAPIFDTGTLIDEGIETLGISWEDLRRVTVHDMLTVLVDHTIGRHVIRETMRATVNGVDRFVAVYGEEPHAMPYVIARRSCRLGRVIEHPHIGLVIAEFLLDRPLVQGDDVLVEYEYATVHRGDPSDSWGRACLTRQREVYMEVEFTEPELPRFVRSRIVQGDVDRSEPAALNGNLLTMLRSDIGPGMTALYWTW